LSVPDTRAPATGGTAPRDPSPPERLRDRLAAALPETAPFRPRLLDCLKRYDREHFARDLGAGLTVGFVALPLALAFAIASGLTPQAGLTTAIIAGLLISALGGTRVSISGPAGAFIVIVYGIVERYGLANLLIATMMAGVLLFAMGWLRLGRLVRFIPVAIVIGFTNGIAVLIILSQLKDALGLRIEKMPADFFAQIGALAANLGSINPYAPALCAGVLALIFAWPKSYALREAPRWKRWLARIPGPVIGLAAATLVVSALALPVETIGSRFGGIPQALPAFALPEFSWTTVKTLLAPTVTIAALVAIESLLCARVTDSLIDDRHDPNQELMAAGVANLVTPLFGGMPATGTIARTVTNVKSGASSPVSGIVHALLLLAVVLVAAPLAEDIPLAALAGILLFVGWNMGEWREFARLRNFALTYRSTLLATFFLTVVFDLTVAVEVGLILSCLFFIYRIAALTQLSPLSLAPAPAGAPLPAGAEAWQLSGALFFGSVGKLEALADPARYAGGDAPRVVILDVAQMLALDTTGLDTLEGLRRLLERRGGALLLAGPRPQPLSLLRRSGYLDRAGEHDVLPDLAAAVCRATALLGAGAAQEAR
jgi:SulP family sulfate permease